MNDVLINIDYEINDMNKKALNVPACQCPCCNNVLISDLVLGKLETFAAQEKGNVIDYVKCEEKEAEVLTVLDAFNFLGR